MEGNIFHINMGIIGVHLGKKTHSLKLDSHLNVTRCEVQRGPCLKLFAIVLLPYFCGPF